MLPGVKSCVRCFMFFWVVTVVFDYPHFTKFSHAQRGMTQFLEGKSVPLQAWTGPEGSRKLRFPDFVTTVQDGGKVVSLTHRPSLPPGNTPGTHFC